MKFRTMFLLVLMTVILAACAPVNAVTGQYVILNPDLQNWIEIGAVVLVGYLLMQLASIPALKWLSDYLGQYKAAVAAWLSGLVVQFLQLQILDKIPQTFDAVVTLVMQLIVAVIVTLYAFKWLKARGVKAFM